MGEYDAYVFAVKTGGDAIERFRREGLPEGIRYVASVTGPWDLFAVATFDEFLSLPGIVAALNVGTETAVAIRPNYTRSRSYHDFSALVRIHVRKGDPRAILEDVQDAIRSHEANLVLGDFDILAYIGADSEDELVDRILYRLRKVRGVRRTVALHVIDYLTLNKQVPDKGHLGHTMRDVRAPARKPTRKPTSRSPKGHSAR